MMHFSYGLVESNFFCRKKPQYVIMFGIFNLSQRQMSNLVCNKQAMLPGFSVFRYLFIKLVRSQSKPSGKLRQLMPSFGCILAVRPKKFILGIKLFCFPRQKAETFRFSLKYKFVKPHKLSTHLDFSDNCYFHLFLSVI